MQNLVSVILPYFNAQKTLGRAIGSILNQSFENFELILVDNTSNDGSQKIAEAFAGEDQRIILVDEGTKGIAHAINKGIQMSNGKFLARMDADDVSRIDRLEKQLEFILTHKHIGAVGGQVNYHGDKEKNGGLSHYVDWSNNILYPEEISLNRFVEFPLVHPTLMFRKEKFDENGMYRSGSFPEDYELFLRWLDQDVQFGKINEVVLDWYDYDERLTRQNSNYSRDAFFNVKIKYLVRWLKIHNPFHPDIWIWGAGKLAKRRSKLFSNEGLNVMGFIDVDQGKKDALHFSSIPNSGKMFVVSLVSNRGARNEIREFLTGKNYKEGKDFIIAA